MIIQNNDIYSIGNVTGNYDKLPIGTYRLRFNERAGEFYLVRIEDFELPSKLYGDFSICDRIINTFNNTSRNLGVLLTGEKGSGKTITAKKVCMNANLPVIIIDENFNQIELISFLADPSIGSCTILIDEFEKVYCCRGCDSTIILQLLDGASNSHHLFILTCNKTQDVNDYLLNRPSRIYYRKEYDSVPEDVIEEIIECELLNKEFKSEVYEVLNQFTTITYDILMSFLKEVNLYNESPLECAKLMNFVPETMYIESTQIFEDGTNVDATDDTWFSHKNTSIEVKDHSKARETGDSSDWVYFRIPIKDLIRKDRHSWEYKKDGKHFLIKKKNFKSLLF